VLVLACSRKAIVISGSLPSKDTVEAPALPHATAVAEGKTIYANRCGRCHALKPVGRYTASEWEPILAAMNKKARLNEMDAAKVVSYVMAGAKKE
jgi:mono/diheme cytochrome c family protein